MSFNHLGYVKGSPLDLVSKKIAELKKAIVTYEALFEKLDNNLNLNLSDLLKLREIGSNVNKGIKTLKEECIYDAKRNGHVIDDEGLYCINCKLNVCEATDGECPNSILRASAVSAASIPDLQPRHTSLPFPFPISGSLPPNTTRLARTGLSGYTAPNVLAKLAASKGTPKGGHRKKRTHRKRRTHRTKKHTLRKHH